LFLWFSLDFSHIIRTVLPFIALLNSACVTFSQGVISALHIKMNCGSHSDIQHAHITILYFAQCTSYKIKENYFPFI
jgi:hypothetical protein